MHLDPWWKAEDTVPKILRSLNITSLPIDPFAIAEAKDIAHQENSSLDAGVSGCLMKVGDQFGIMYSSRFASEGFRHFTIGHELGHYFLEGHVDHLFQNGNTVHQSASGFLSNDRFEREADAFAASLLMPKNLFLEAKESAGNGLEAITSLATLCGTSLTATGIRYARLAKEPVAVVCSKGQKVLFAFMSESLKRQRNLTWLQKGSGLPADSVTATFNKDPENIRKCRNWEGESTVADWFHGDDVEINEEVIGLGDYGRTLTMLWPDSLTDPEESVTRSDGREDDDAESLLPSERFFRKSRYC